MSMINLMLDCVEHKKFITSGPGDFERMGSDEFVQNCILGISECAVLLAPSKHITLFQSQNSVVFTSWHRIDVTTTLCLRNLPLCV